jgi:hypothetical protein
MMTVRNSNTNDNDFLTTVLLSVPAAAVGVENDVAPFVNWIVKIKSS